MKRETDRLRVFTMLALAAALFTLFRTFPLSGDDWFREGLEQQTALSVTLHLQTLTKQ